MPLPEDEFGSGIETAAQATNAAAVQTASSESTAIPAAPASNVDEFMTQFRGVVDGIPEGLSRDQLTDHLIELQTRASRAEALEQQNAEYQAQLAIVARKATTTEQATETPAPEVDDFELPWKPVKVDPQVRSMVKADPETGGYVPRNPTSSLHIAAAEEMNRRAQYEHNFGNSLFDDPEGTVTTLTKRQLAALRKEYDEKFKSFEARFQPIQQATEEAKAADEMNMWCSKHATKLYAPGEDDKFSALGTLVDSLLRTNKFTPDEALAYAESITPAAVPATTTAVAKPAAKPVFAKPARMVDGIADRQRKSGQPPAERRAYDGGSGKWKKSWDDVDQSVTALYGDH